jgi:hypothetical protein
MIAFYLFVMLLHGHAYVLDHHQTLEERLSAVTAVSASATVSEVSAMRSAINVYRAK